MSDVVFNFSSQWPSIQVARVIEHPDVVGEAASSPYSYKVAHNLGYPPLTFSYNITTGIFGGIDVDENYVYTSTDAPIVIHAVDINSPFEYTNYENKTGTIVKDNSGGSLDLRRFLLHSRAVSPMLLSVTTKAFTNASVADTTMTYTHSLSYPIFQFGYQRYASDTGIPWFTAGVWKSVPLAGQAWPVLNTNGFTATQTTSIIGGSYDGSFNWIPGTGKVATDIGSIITLRNPAIVTNNTVSASI